MHTHGNQPVRRLRDHQIVQERRLWDAQDPSERGRAGDVRFRVGRCGRFEWEKGGEEYYVQFLPPGLQGMAAPPEFMVVQMDYAGVRAAVLQNDPIYGDLAGYFAEAIRRHPGRFIGLARVDEAFAYRDDQMAALRDAVEGLGMKGLYFTTAGFFRNGYREYYDGPNFRPFWDAVRRLRVPVFWVFFGDSPVGGFAEEMAVFLKWLERYPDVPSVLVHGIPTGLFADAQDRVRFPEYVTRMMEDFPVYSEVLYPIAWGGKTDFPYLRAQDHIRQVYDRFGPDRLIWGSDMPNVERYCTYRQALTYVQAYCDFLSGADREKILGRNVLSLFGRRSG
jgi:predicted TIM-barrel fold metal-dependent hydrolase